MTEPRSLFIIDLTYVVSLDEVDALIEPHLNYLERGYVDGVFLASGRKVPRTGGIIIAVERSRDEIEIRVATDPFVSEGAAKATVTEMVPSKAAAGDLRLLFGIPSD